MGESVVGFPTQPYSGCVPPTHVTGQGHSRVAGVRVLSWEVHGPAWG